MGVPYDILSSQKYPPDTAKPIPLPDSPIKLFGIEAVNSVHCCCKFSNGQWDEARGLGSSQQGIGY